MLTYNIIEITPEKCLKYKIGKDNNEISKTDYFYPTPVPMLKEFFPYRKPGTRKNIFYPLPQIIAYAGIF